MCNSSSSSGLLENYVYTKNSRVVCVQELRVMTKNLLKVTFPIAGMHYRPLCILFSKAQHSQLRPDFQRETF